jgi:integrase
VGKTTKVQTPPRDTAKRFHFTQRSIQALPIPAEKREAWRDTETRELGLLVQASGHKSFFWFRKIRGKPTWRTIGSVEDVPLDDARDQAKAWSVAITKWKNGGYEGDNPLEPPRKEPTLGELNEHYVEHHLLAHAKNPEDAAKNARWSFGRYLAGWRNSKLGDIRRADVRDLHREITRRHGPYAANRTVQHLKVLFNHALRHEVWRGENPAQMVALNREVKRKRYLLPSETYQFFAAVKEDPNPDVPDFVGLALWTAARKSDVLAMRWQDVQLDNNKWTVPNPKNKESYDVALTPEAVEILRRRLSQRAGDSPWVFPSHGKTGHLVDLKRRWTALRKRAGLEDLTQHDLRRTNLSWQAAAGTSPQIIMKAGGHKTITAAMIYQQLDLDPVRASVMSATRAILASAKKKPEQLAAASKRKAKQLAGADA